MYKLFWYFKTLIIYKFIFGNIGKLTYIGKPVFLKGTKNVFIGNRVRIFPGLRIETHNNGMIIIEDNVGIGQNVHLTSSDITLTIKKNTTILGNVFITNIDHDYKELNRSILEQKYIVNKTEIGENCFIGYGAAIQAGTILGKQCIVGTNSVVRGIFPDYSVIVGVPAKIIKRYNFKTNKWERTNDKGDFINE